MGSGRAVAAVALFLLHLASCCEVEAFLHLSASPQRPSRGRGELLRLQERVGGEREGTMPEYMRGLEGSDIWDTSDDEEEEVEEGGAGGSVYAGDVPKASEMGDLVFSPNEDEFGLGSASLQNICDDYGFPVEVLLDVLCRWGVEPPIDPGDKLGSLVDSEQAYAVLELLNSVDSAVVYDTYTLGTLEEIADDLDVPLGEVFAICGRRRFNLPEGVETCITQAEYRILLQELGLEGMPLSQEQQQGTPPGMQL